jgi:hypothetical protein
VEIHPFVRVGGDARVVRLDPTHLLEPDLSREAETCRVRLVGNAAVQPRTGRLASEGLDEDLHAFPKTQLQVKCALLLDVAVSKGTTILKLLAS